MKCRALIVILLVISTPVAAVGEGELEELKEKYNNQTDQVPDFVSNIVGGETVNIEINRSTEEETIGIAMEGVKVDEIRKGGYEDNTMIVETDWKTVEKVRESEQPLDQVQKEIESDDIEYKSTTFVGSLKIIAMNSLRNMKNVLGL